MYKFDLMFEICDFIAGIQNKSKELDEISKREKIRKNSTADI